MAGTSAESPGGGRITDYISVGVVAETFPRQRVDAVLAQTTGRASQRQRDLTAHVMVYYVIALALYVGVSYREVLRYLLEGVEWLRGPDMAVKVAGKSGISQSRPRAGLAVSRCSGCMIASSSHWCGRRWPTPRRYRQYATWSSNSSFPYAAKRHRALGFPKQTPRA